MRRFLSLCLLMLLIGPCLMAQSFRASTRLWNLGPLDWQEMQGTAPSDSADNQLVVGLRSMMGVYEEGITRYSFYKFMAYSDMNESWTDPERRTPTRLIYLQMLFDLAEYYARQATLEINTSYDSFPEDVALFFLRQYQKKSQEIGEQTNQGMDSLLVVQKAEEIRQMLLSSEFKPQASAFALIPSHSLAIYFGLGTRIPTTTDFYTPTYGLSFGFDYEKNRHVFGIDLGLEFGGRCQRDFSTHSQYILKGENVQSGAIYLTYGRNLSEGARSKLIPYAGLGVSFLDGPEREDLSGRKQPNECAGFSFCIGANYDLICRRHITLNNPYTIPDKDYMGIRFRPYLSFTNFTNEIGWKPSINLSVTFVLGDSLYR